MGIGVFEGREYMNQIGGEIDVESELHKGTTFTLKFQKLEPDLGHELNGQKKLASVG
jgi:signal transduction histidine kinase